MSHWRSHWSALHVLTPPCFFGCSRVNVNPILTFQLGQLRPEHNTRPPQRLRARPSGAVARGVL